MAYLLDTNVFIEGKNRYYGFDICPGFWDWLVAENTAGRLFSIEKVGGELRAGEDQLAEWAEARGAGFFQAPDPTVLPALARVSEWSQSQRYEPAAITTFLEGADFYLVAHAVAHDHVVVTHEVPADSLRKVKIPNACIGLGVTCVNPFEMLRASRARFVLAS
jgi:predicted nucleic acid-binding protein